MPDTHWTHLNRPEFGLMNQFSDLVASLDVNGQDRLPDLSRVDTILIGSDYSGDYAQCDYDVISFIIADIAHSQRWQMTRRRIRSSLATKGQRFAFKSLRDRRLLRLLPFFLAGADQIPGALVSILTNKRISSLFKITGRIGSSDSQIAEFPGWKPRVLERLLRVAHFVSLFLAGLSRPMQNVLWVTDEDAIVANEAKHREFVTIFGRIASHYLPHTLNKLRIATTASDTGKRDLEDFVAIPDLACGALSEVMTKYRRGEVCIGRNVITPPPPHVRPKTRQLMAWLADHRWPLKKLCFLIEPVEASTALTISSIQFHGAEAGDAQAGSLIVSP